MSSSTAGLPYSEADSAASGGAPDELCVHCGSALGRFWKAEDGPFCCRGCRHVHELIHDGKLERYYDLRPDTQAPAATIRGDSFNWLDRLIDEQAARDAVTAQGNGQQGNGQQGIWQLSLDIQGVHCAACVWLLEELFRRSAGGIDLRINPTLGQVELSWDPARGDLKNYLCEVENFGYRLGPRRKTASRSSRALLMRLALSVAVALNVMMFSLSYYFGLAPEDGALYGFFGWLSLGLATLSVVVGGQVFFRGALAGLRRRIAHLDLPISLGMLLAYLGSVYAFLSGGPETAYFDTLTIFVALMLIGRWAQEHILERNRNALLDDAGAENLTVKRQSRDRLEAVAATRVQRGDELWIAPGDLVPVDGVLLRKETEVSLDWITGESDPVALAPGDIAPAGAFNATEGGFAVTAVEDFAASRLGELLRAPALRSGEFLPLWWHRISTIYVAAVLILASTGFILWFGHDPTIAFKVTIGVLVVTCPCALGLATPLAEELIHHRLRRHGIFLRTPTFLDKALQVRKILLDKTGTLTLGELQASPETAAALRALAPADQLVLAQMTARSNHPVSRCLAATMDRMEMVKEGGSEALAPASVTGIAATGIENLSELPGRGLRWRHGAHEYRLGRPHFALGDTDRSTDRSTDRGAESQETLFARDGQPLARLRFLEHFKADAAAELADLAAAGYDLHLLSGDSPAKVREAARQLGIDPAKARGGLGPEAKAACVRALDEHDTLMVGDGLNASPSFAAALCAATPAVDRPVLPGKADFYFLGDGIAAIRRALFAAKQLRRVVRGNLVIAVLYNVIAAGLCLAGLVTPVVAAILMPASSVAVVSLTAWRLSGRRLTWMS